jgi:nucleotide-binding universal stress UspA family protein
MSPALRERKLERILVAFDTDEPGATALEAAAELAASVQAELAGLLVEDINVMRLVGMPFASEICRFTAVQRRLESGDVERQLRVRAGVARRSLARVAEQAGLRWSFRISRGVVAATLLEALLEADMVALGATRQGRVRHPTEGRRAEPGPHRPVVAAYSGSVVAQHALSVAARVARDTDRPLQVLLVAESADAAARLREQAVESLRGLVVGFRPLIGADLPSLLTAVRALSPARLVLGGEESLLQPGAIQTLLELTTCPVLVVR